MLQKNSVPHDRYFVFGQVVPCPLSLCPATALASTHPPPPDPKEKSFTSTSSPLNVIHKPKFNAWEWPTLRRPPDAVFAFSKNKPSSELSPLAHCTNSCTRSRTDSFSDNTTSKAPVTEVHVTEVTLSEVGFSQTVGFPSRLTSKGCEKRSLQQHPARLSACAHVILSSIPRLLQQLVEERVILSPRGIKSNVGQVDVLTCRSSSHRPLRTGNSIHSPCHTVH